MTTPTDTAHANQTDKELEARLGALLDGATPDFPREWEAIEEELRWRREPVVSIIQIRGD